MAIDRLPSGLVPSGGSLIFEETTIPDALKREHALAAGHWGVLHVLEGDIRFVDLASGEERIFSAPDLVTIQPQAPHLVIIDGLVRCRIDFFRELGADSLMRTPGSFADEAVRASFERCELNGDFAEFFYDAFLNSSAEIASHFAQTEFERQRKVLRDSVHVMVTRDVADAAMRVMLDRLGKAHGRAGRNIRPVLYELWLDSICQAVKALDPQWSKSLERMWRVRLRPGMQIIMAAY